MLQQTAEIIMICKGRHDYGDNLTHKQAIAAYLSDQCFCSIEYISDNDINDVIWQAAIDYINGFKEHLPGSFLQYAKEVYDRHNNPLNKNFNRIDIYEAICSAFQMAQVKSDGGKYINGFTEENTRFVYKTNSN